MMNCVGNHNAAEVVVESGFHGGGGEIQLHVAALPIRWCGARRLVPPWLCVDDITRPRAWTIAAAWCGGTAGQGSPAHPVSMHVGGEGWLVCRAAQHVEVKGMPSNLQLEGLTVSTGCRQDEWGR